MPHYDLYPIEVRPLVDARGPAWVNKLSERTLGFPALLITTPTETHALIARAEKEIES